MGMIDSCYTLREYNRTFYINGNKCKIHKKSNSLNDDRN